MKRAVDFYYDFGSPNAYLAHKVLPIITDRYNAQLICIPILVGGIFKSTSNQPPIAAFGHVQGKVPYLQTEIVRFCERHKVPFQMNPHFPVRTVTLMRAATYARGKPWEDAFVETCFDGLWQRGENLDDPAVLHQTLLTAQLPADDIMNATQDAEIKEELKRLTSQAVERGAFGTPTMFIGDEMFFGKDSLDDLDWRLSQSS